MGGCLATQPRDPSEEPEHYINVLLLGMPVLRPDPQCGSCTLLPALLPKFPGAVPHPQAHPQLVAEVPNPPSLSFLPLVPPLPLLPAFRPSLNLSSHPSLLSSSSLPIPTMVLHVLSL